MTTQTDFEKQIKSINQIRNQSIAKINSESNKIEFKYVQSFYKNNVLPKLDISNPVESKMTKLITQTLDVLDKNYSSTTSSKHVMILKLITQYKTLIGNAYIQIINKCFDANILAKNPLEYPHYEEINLDHLDEYTKIITKFDSIIKENFTQNDIQKWRKVINNE